MRGFALTDALMPPHDRSRPVYTGVYSSTTDVAFSPEESVAPCTRGFTQISDLASHTSHPNNQTTPVSPNHEIPTPRICPAPYPDQPSEHDIATAGYNKKPKPGTRVGS